MERSRIGSSLLLLLWLACLVPSQAAEVEAGLRPSGSSDVGKVETEQRLTEHSETATAFADQSIEQLSTFLSVRGVYCDGCEEKGDWVRHAEESKHLPELLAGFPIFDATRQADEQPGNDNEGVDGQAEGLASSAEKSKQSQMHRKGQKKQNAAKSVSEMRSKFEAELEQTAEKMKKAFGKNLLERLPSMSFDDLGAYLHAAERELQQHPTILGGKVAASPPEASSAADPSSDTRSSGSSSSASSSIPEGEAARSTGFLEEQIRLLDPELLDALENPSKANMDRLQLKYPDIVGPQFISKTKAEQRISKNKPEETRAAQGLSEAKRGSRKIKEKSARAELEEGRSREKSANEGPKDSEGRSEAHSALYADTSPKTDHADIREEL